MLLVGCSQPLPSLPPGVFIPSEQQLPISLTSLTLLRGSPTLPKNKFIALQWASWCPTCRAEFPYIVSLAKQNITVVGITFRDSTNDTLAFIQNNGNPFVSIYVDDEQQFATALNSQSIPTAFFFDSNGALQARLIGGLNQLRWENMGLGRWFDSLE